MSMDERGSLVVDLTVQPSWEQAAKRAKSSRMAVNGGAAFVGVLWGLALYATVGDVVRGDPNWWVAFGVFVVFLWLFATVLSMAIYDRGPPPTQLVLSAEGIELYYLPGVVRFRRRWSDPHLRLVLRDFRGYPGPADQDVVLDTGDHRMLSWPLPSRSPPSAYLTPDALDAILAEAARHHLKITHRKGSSAAWVYKNEEIWIRPASG
jgi:hypothetical protein